MENIKKMLTEAKRAEMAEEAYERAVSGNSLVNEAITIKHFQALGYADVRPRENVLTFWAWQAVGRKVKKGEHGLKLTTWIVRETEDPKTGEKKTRRYPKTAVVFHFEQTEARQ